MGGMDRRTHPGKEDKPKGADRGSITYAVFKYVSAHLSVVCGGHVSFQRNLSTVPTRGSEGKWRKVK